MAGENINRRLNIYINDREVVNSMRGVTAEMARVRNQLRNLNAGAEDYDQQLQHLTTTYARLQQEQTRFRNDLAQTPGILGRIRNALGPVASGMLAAFSVGAIIATVTTKLREASRIVVDFDQKQADLAAIMQKSRTQIAGLTLDALKYGSTTSYTASEVSILQTELARLGKTAPEIKAMTESVLNAATALESDLGSSATLIGGQLNSYGEGADQAAKYSDIMANSVNISATSFESLNTALPKVSKVAAINNVTFEKLNATLGVLADENIAAETAGTGFRNILLESAKVGKPYEELLREIATSTNQTKKATELFGKENATVAVILANSTQKIQDQTRALESSAGSAEKLAKEKLNSIAGSTKLFSSAWEGFLLNIEKGDGVIGKAVRGIVDFGSGILGLITPMNKLSDQLKEEQMDLNMLVSKITSSNVSNEERRRLLVELKDQYPDFIKNINIETVSNGELNQSLSKINEQYIKRIALQEQVEEVESKQQDVGNNTALKLKEQEKLFKTLQASKLKYNLPIEIDYGNLEKSGKEIQAALKKMKVEGGALGFSGLQGDIEASLSYLKAYQMAIDKSSGELSAQTEILDRQSKSLGINTEAQNENVKANEAAIQTREEIIKQATSMGLKNARENTTAELKVWIDAQKEKAMYADEFSAEEAAKRAKAIEDAKKHSQDLLDNYKTSQNELLETQRQFEDAKLANMQDGYDKERDLLNLEYNRKIEDLKLKALQEQTEIENLEKQKRDPKNSKGDVATLQKEIEVKKQILESYNASVIVAEEARNIKLATLQEKYLEKEIQDQEKANQKALQSLQTRHNEELASATTIEDAKALLSQYYSAEEIAKIKTLGDARTKLKEGQAKEEFEVQVKYLQELQAQLQTLLLGNEAGITLISDEEKQKTLEHLDELASKIAGLKAGNSDKETEKTAVDSGLSGLSGLDILGFSPEQWDSAFNQLDTFEGKIAAIEMAVGAVKEAFGMYFQFLEAGEQRSLQKAEAANRKKQAALSDQLERGYITQEVYNARKEKLDQDLEKKKAEIEYKRAKREKLMNIASIISNTALGVIKAVAASPLTSGMPWAGIIAGMGAANLALAIAQPLPPKSGFKKGGYTGNGSPDEIAGDVHKGEYVIPQNVLFSNDPVVPNIVGYIEQKRTGGSPKVSTPGDDGNAPQTSGGGSNDNAVMIPVLNRLSDAVEKLTEGVPAYLENDIPTAKKMREKIKELNDLENKAKV
jgi:hypothetical protein